MASVAGTTGKGCQTSAAPRFISARSSKNPQIVLHKNSTIIINPTSDPETKGAGGARNNHRSPGLFD
jgi:hypothetical protein